MRGLLCLLALAGVSLASRDMMLETNRIPEKAVAAFGDTCGECKSVVKRFLEAVDDPQKMAELKMLLSALCHETSYAEECKMFVSKLDIIIKRLEPYLRDGEAVCKRMHLCSNAKINAFHRIGLLYMKQGMAKVDGTKDFVCDECQLAAIELKKAIDDEEQRKAIKSFISENICKRIAKYQGACDLMLEEFLPELWQELDNLLANPKQACGQIGFCERQSTGRMNKALTSPKMTLHGFFKRSKYLAGPKGTVLISCFECKIAFDALIADLKDPAQQQKISNDLRDDVCPQLPTNMYDGCLDFVNMYGPTVVHMTVLQMDAEKMCQDFGSCDARSIFNLRAMSKQQKEALKCDACKAFTAFLEYEFTLPDFKNDLVAGVSNMACSRLRGGFENLCENFASSYLPLVVDKAAEKLSAKANFCSQMIHAC